MHFIHKYKIIWEGEVYADGRNTMGGHEVSKFNDTWMWATLKECIECGHRVAYLEDAQGNKHQVMAKFLESHINRTSSACVSGVADLDSRGNPKYREDNEIMG